MADFHHNFIGILLCILKVEVSFVIRKVVAPAVVGDDGAMVCGPFDGILETSAEGRSVRRGIENLAGDQPGPRVAGRCVAARNTAHPDPVVVDRGDRSADMGSMARCRNSAVPFCKVIAGSCQDLSGKVFMVGINASVDDGDDDVGTAFSIVLPDGKDIDITSLFTTANLKLDT